MKDNKAKIYMISSLVVLVIAVIVSGTYAYYVWTTSDSDTTKIVAGIGAATVTFDGGSDISANLRPVSDKSKGIVKNISVKGDTTGLVFNMYLDITSIDTGLKDESFRYELYKGTTKVKEGNFSDSYLTSNTVTCTKNNTNHIVLLTNESISTSKTSYTLYIWINGVNYTNPNTMMNKTFSFKLHADGEGAVLAKTAAQTITELYTTASKALVTNNSITYNTAPTVSLMNDRLGGTAEDLNGGNIRYYGESPNNYVYFNCETYSSTYYNWQSSNTQEHLNNPKSESECLTNFNNYYNCSTNYTELGFDNQTDCEKQFTENELNAGRQILCTGKGIKEPTNCELWRIIGVFDGKLKITNPTINDFYFPFDYDKNDDGTSTTYDSNWSTSTLQKLLNNGYYNNTIGEITYYYTDSSLREGNNTKNMSNIGLKNVDTRKLISSEKWYLGSNYGLDFANEAYVAERSNISCEDCNYDVIWNGNIALPYLSDFGYAGDFNACNVSTFSSNCKGWMLFSSMNYWLLSINNATTIMYYNFFYGNIQANLSSVSYNVLPTLYLIPDIKIVGGTGKSDNPYLISK